METVIIFYRYTAKSSAVLQLFRLSTEIRLVEIKNLAFRLQLFTSKEEKDV